MQPELKHVILTLTYACQLRCKMCGQVNLPEGEKLASGMLDTELVLKRLEELPTLKTCYLFGGEPLLHKDFFQIVDYLVKRKVWCGFSTNGLLLGENAERIVDSGVDMLSISLDSHRAEVHDEIRGRQGLFETACENLRTMLDYRTARGSSLPSTKVHFTILPDNIGDMKDYYEYFVARFPEVDTIKFHFPRFVTEETSDTYSSEMKKLFGICPTSHHGSFAKVDELTAMDCDRLHGIIADLLQRPKASITGPESLDGIREYFLEPGKPPEGGRCACFKSVTVQPDGTVVNCADYPDLVYGDIATSSLTDIWKSEVVLRWQEYLEKHGNPGALARCSRLYPNVNSRAK